jgi:hypothetical protein
LEIFYDSQKSVAAPLVICLPGPIPYVFEKVIPYKYNATMMEGGREVQIPPLPSMGNIAGDSRVLRTWRVVPLVFPKKASAPTIEDARAEDSSTAKDAG